MSQFTGFSWSIRYGSEWFVLNLQVRASKKKREEKSKSIQKELKK